MESPFNRNRASTYMITTLVVYEYCVTFEAEIRLFWRRKATRSNVLFFFNRYVCLANRVAVLAVEALSQHAVSRLDPLTNLFCMAERRVLGVLGWSGC